MRVEGRPHTGGKKGTDRAPNLDLRGVMLVQGHSTKHEMLFLVRARDEEEAMGRVAELTGRTLLKMGGDTYLVERKVSRNDLREELAGNLGDPRYSTRLSAMKVKLDVNLA